MDSNAVKSFIFFIFCIALPTFIPTPLSGWVEPSRGKFAIEGELLYFSPSYDETYFVINGSALDGLGNLTPSGKRINNPVSFDLGFRLQGIYGFCSSCTDFRLRWTHVYATSSQNVSNNDTPSQLWPTETIPNLPNISEPFSGLATSHIGVMYQKGECLFDERAWDFYYITLSFREGIEWSYIRYHEVVDYFDRSGSKETIQFHAHTKGIGPQLGIILICKPYEQFNWHPKNLSYRFMTTASLIAANSKSKYKATDIHLANNKVTQSSFWRFVPEWVLCLGINYSSCWGNHQTHLEMGYEMTTYVRGTSKLIFTDSSSPGLSFNQYSDFYVHGVFFSFGIVF